MLEIHVTVSCPDLLAAVQLLKGIAPGDARNPEPAINAPMGGCTAPAAAPTAVPVAAPVAVPLAVAPNTVPLAVAPNTVPLASAPTFTKEQICKAGAELVTKNPGVMPQVNGLLAQYGAQTVMELKPEHFGAVATALRGMGAKI